MPPKSATNAHGAATASQPRRGLAKAAVAVTAVAAAAASAKSPHAKSKAAAARASPPAKAVRGTEKPPSQAAPSSTPSPSPPPPQRAIPPRGKDKNARSRRKCGAYKQSPAQANKLALKKAAVEQVAAEAVQRKVQAAAKKAAVAQRKADWVKRCQEAQQHGKKAPNRGGPRGPAVPMPLKRAAVSVMLYLRDHDGKTFTDIVAELKNMDPQSFGKLTPPQLCRWPYTVAIADGGILKDVADGDEFARACELITSHSAAAGHQRDEIDALPQPAADNSAR